MHFDLNYYQELISHVSPSTLILLFAIANYLVFAYFLIINTKLIEIIEENTSNALKSMTVFSYDY